MQSNNFFSSNSTIMHWTQPDTHEQRRYFSNFAAVLTALSISRRAIQLVWMVVAAMAMAYILHEAASRFMALPYSLCLAVSLVVSAVLHRLLSATTKAHYFDKWDNDPLTNSSLLAPAIIALFLVGLEYKALSGFFVSKIELPTEITDTTEGDYSQLVAATESRYNAEKQRITDNYNERVALISPTLTKRLENLQAQRKRARNTDDRDYLKAMIAKTEKDIEGNSKLRDLRMATDGQLSTLLNDHQAELKRLEAKRDKGSEHIASKNTKAENDYQAATLSAKGYAGIISACCLVFFFLFTRQEVRIKTKSGIFPIRHFSELDAHGNALEKAGHVFSDIFKRSFHHAIYGYHRRASKSLGELSNLDGSLTVKPGDYQPKTRHLHAIHTATQQPPTQQPFSANTIGFKMPDTAAQTLVSQATQPHTAPPTQPPDTVQHIVLTQPSEDISKLKNYCREYYRRSVKQTSADETKEANFQKYEHYKALLEIAGFEVVPSGGETLLIQLKIVAA